MSTVRLSPGREQQRGDDSHQYRRPPRAVRLCILYVTARLERWIRRHNGIGFPWSEHWPQRPVKWSTSSQACASVLDSLYGRSARPICYNLSAFASSRFSDDYVSAYPRRRLSYDEFATDAFRTTDAVGWKSCNPRISYSWMTCIVAAMSRWLVPRAFMARAGLACEQTHSEDGERFEEFPIRPLGREEGMRYGYAKVI